MHVFCSTAHVLRSRLLLVGLSRLPATIRTQPATERIDGHHLSDRNAPLLDALLCARDRSTVLLASPGLCPTGDEGLLGRGYRRAGWSQLCDERWDARSGRWFHRRSGMWNHDE